MTSGLSRRQFVAGSVAGGGALMVQRRATAASFELRQFHNQPVDNPLHQRLVDMWDAVRRETNGQVSVQTFADNNRIGGGDPAALAMVQRGELDFFTLNGGSIGNVVPAVNVQGLLFAFRDTEQVFTALDTDLGEHLRSEARTKGLYLVPHGCFDNGFHEITCATRPIRGIDDLVDLRIRTPDAAIYVEAWQALGATPVVTNLNRLYETLASGAAQAQTNPLVTTEFLKLYEVQRYVSMTNHGWSGFNLLANLRIWDRLPSHAHDVIHRNVVKATLRQRADNAAANEALRSTLAARGMVFNDSNAAPFRARLVPYYKRWKESVGTRAWSLLEAHVGKLNGKDST